MEYGKGVVFEAKVQRRNGAATHAVVIEVYSEEVRLRSVRLDVRGKPEFFHGAQTRNIPIDSIPVRYRATDMVMKLD
jgi:hypothetical protein